MTPEFTFDSLALGVLAFLLTYLLHSTLLLGGVFCADKLGWLRSTASEDTLWKVALVGGLVTASVVSVTGFTPWGGRLTLGDGVLTADVSADMPSEAPTETIAALPTPAIAPSTDSRMAQAVLARSAPRPRPAGQQGRLAFYQQRLATQQEALGPSVFSPRMAAVKSTRQGEAVPALGFGPGLTSALVSQPLEPQRVPESPMAVRTDSADSASMSPVQPVQASALSWISLTFAGWLLILVGGLWRSLILRRQLSKVLAGRRDVLDPSLVECLDRLADKAGLSGQVRLSTSSSLSSPVAMGSREICLPPQALTELSPAGQEAMLAHELAHLVRHDPAWLAFCQLLEATLFFQPLNRLGRKRLQATAEFLCDDWAVATTGRRREFAQCLAQVASWMASGSVRPRLPAAVPAMARSESALVQRVQRLARGVGARAAHRGQLAALSLVVLGAVSCGVPTIAPSGDESLVDRVVGAVSQALQGLSLTESEPGPVAAALMVPVTRVSEVQAVADDEDEEQATVELRFQGDIAVEISASGLTALTLDGEALQVRHQGERLLLVSDASDVPLSVQRFDLSPVDGEMTLSLTISADDLGHAQALGHWETGHTHDHPAHDHQAEEREGREREAEHRALLREYEQASASFEREQQRAEELFARELAQAERQAQREQEDQQRAVERELQAVTGRFEKQLRELEQEEQAQRTALEREYRQTERDMSDESEEWEQWVSQWEQRSEEIDEELERFAEDFEAEYDEQLEELEWMLMSEAEAWETDWARGMEEAEWEFDQSMEAAEFEFEMWAEELDRQIEELEARDCDHGCETECAFGCTHPDDDRDPAWADDCDLDGEDECDQDWDDDCDLDDECESACDSEDREESCESEQGCDDDAGDEVEESDDLVFGSSVPKGCRAAA